MVLWYILLTLHWMPYRHGKSAVSILHILPSSDIRLSLLSESLVYATVQWRASAMQPVMSLHHVVSWEHLWLRDAVFPRQQQNKKVEQWLEIDLNGSAVLLMSHHVCPSEMHWQQHSTQLNSLLYETKTKICNHGCRGTTCMQLKQPQFHRASIENMSCTVVCPNAFIIVNFSYVHCHDETSV